MSLKLPNYTQIECEVYDANYQYLRDSTILPIKAKVNYFGKDVRLNNM